MTARRCSYLAATVVNVALVCANLIVMAAKYWYGVAGAAETGIIAGFGAIAVWLVIAMDARIVTQQATLDSYHLEQLADTRMKQFMVEQLESGKAGLTLTGTPPSDPTGRAH